MQITKKKASQKPTYDSLRLSLEDMKLHCEKHGVTKISMPRYVSSPVINRFVERNVHLLSSIYLKLLTRFCSGSVAITAEHFVFISLPVTVLAVAWIDWSGRECRRY